MDVLVRIEPRHPAQQGLTAARKRQMQLGALVSIGVATVVLSRFALKAWSNRSGKIALAEGQPETKEGVNAAQQGDWPTFEKLYCDRPPSDRYHFLRGVGALSKLDGPTPPPNSATAATIDAGLRLGWAWRHRGDGLGETINQRGAENMARLLGEAASLLDNREDLDSVACALRIRIEMGLGGSRGVLQQQLNAAAALNQPNIFVPINHLMFIAPKWYGSVDEILDVAKDYAAQETNPAWKALPAMAHAECWLYRSLMADSITEKREANSYYFGDAFRGEIEALDDEFWSARNNSTAPVSHAELTFAHNQFAYLFYTFGGSSRLDRHLDYIGKDLTRFPWAYAGLEIEHGGALSAIREQAGRTN